MSNDKDSPSLLRSTQHVFTTHDPSSKKAVILKTRPGEWSLLDEGKMVFDVIYTTSEFPADLNNDNDIKTHDSLIQNGNLGLVNLGGTICRQVDFAPGYTTFMHRTKSLDYGVVIQGQIVLTLDSGEKQILEPGDVAIQRATNHAWTNPSQTEWTRMMFVLQECRSVEIGGTTLEEYHERPVDGIPLSQKLQ